MTKKEMIEKFLYFLEHHNRNLTKQQDWAINDLHAFIFEQRELLAKAKGIISVYMNSGNESTYTEKEIKDLLNKIDGFIL